MSFFRRNFNIFCFILLKHSEHLHQRAGVTVRGNLIKYFYTFLILIFMTPSNYFFSLFLWKYDFTLFIINWGFLPWCSIKCIRVIYLFCRCCCWKFSDYGISVILESSPDVKQSLKTDIKSKLKNSTHHKTQGKNKGNGCTGKGYIIDSAEEILPVEINNTRGKLLLGTSTWCHSNLVYLDHLWLTSELDNN